MKRIIQSISTYFQGRVDRQSLAFFLTVFLYEQIEYFFILGFTVPNSDSLAKYLFAVPMFFLIRRYGNIEEQIHLISNSLREIAQEFKTIKSKEEEK